MITIRFTQCACDFKMDKQCEAAALMPIDPRCDIYLRMLRRAPIDVEFATMDEHLLLIAQYLVRKKIIEHTNIQFVSVCWHVGAERTIRLDEDGDMLDDMQAIRN